MNIKHYLIACSLILAIETAFAQQKWEDIDTSGYYKKEVIKKGDYTLIFINKDSLLKDDTKKRMIDCFFTAYPAEANRFNHKAARMVTLDVGTDYKGVAATEGAFIKIDQDYLRKYPQDIDVVTHEGMHVVQSYGDDDNVPGWITEGVADYARYTYGVNNEKANWRLPDYGQDQNYSDAYRVTARFFVWLSRHTRADIVDKIDTAARKKVYTPQLWVKLTGKSVDEWWYLYITNPAL